MTRTIIFPAIGALLAIAAFIALATTSHFSLTQDRLAAAVREANMHGDLDWDANHNEDYFTECSLLMMERLRRGQLLHDIIDTRWALLDFGHPCETLKAMLDGKLKASSVYTYSAYPFAPRHLAAVAISLTGIGQAKNVYLAAAYASIIAFVAGAFLSFGRRALPLLPIGAVLILGFSLHRFGHNIAHSPGITIGLFGLALLAAAPRLFERQEIRFGYLTFLAGIVAVFDMFNGALLTTLSLTLVVNQLLYSESASWKIAIKQIAVIVVCFLFAYVAVTVPRLAALAFLYDADHSWTQYYARLMFRVGSDLGNGAHAGIPEIATALWSARFQLTPGGYIPATALLIASVVAWVAALIGAALNKPNDKCLVDLAVLIIAAGGIGLWFALFPSHTVIHRLLSVRYLALPIGYGFAAVMLMWPIIPWLSSSAQSRP